MKAVFLDRGSFPENIDIPLPDCITQSEFYHNSDDSNVVERIQDAEIILTNKVKLNQDQLAQAPYLKLIQVMATGLNNVDLEACASLGIAVRNVSGYSTEAVPEHTFSLILALRRKVFQYHQDVRNGRWANSEFFCFMDHPMQDIYGSTLAIIGKGALGTRVATIAEAFGMKTIFAEHKSATKIRSGYVAFEEAISSADIITLHCPLTSDTKDLIDEEAFAKMKSNALVINTGRGGLVNEEDLVSALTSGQIAGAGFDVATVEPMPQDHILNTLMDMPNFLLTPHVAWASENAMTRLVNIAANSIETFIIQEAK